MKLLAFTLLSILNAQRVTIFNWTFRSNDDGWEVDQEDNSLIITNSDKCPSGSICFKLGADDDIYVTVVLAAEYHSINLKWSMYSLNSKVELWIDWIETAVYGSGGGIEHFDVPLLDVDHKTRFDMDFYARNTLWINDVALTGIRTVPAIDTTKNPTKNPLNNPTTSTTLNPTIDTTNNPTSNPTLISTSNTTLIPTSNPPIPTTTPASIIASHVQSLSTDTLVNMTDSKHSVIILYIGGGIASFCVLCLCVLIIWKVSAQKKWDPEPHDTEGHVCQQKQKGSFLSSDDTINTSTHGPALEILSSITSLDGMRTIGEQYIVTESLASSPSSKQQKGSIEISEGERSASDFRGETDIS